jgi:segregation and condensation protein B
MTTDPQPALSLPLPAIVESLLFVASAPVSVHQLADAIGCHAAEVEAALQSLASTYATQRGLRLQRHGDRLQLVTAPDVAPFVERFLGLAVTTSLSPAALETLAVVAYKQPITRPELEAIRGVNSDGVLRNLVSKGLVEEVGRLETVGHPILFGTTFDFLQYFGLNGLGELPPLEDHPSDDAQDR